MSVEKIENPYSKNEISSWFKKKNFKEIAKDLKHCLKLILEQKDTKSADVFSSLLSLKIVKSRAIFSDFEKQNVNAVLLCAFLLPFWVFFRLIQS